jgi:putative SOS response-associated peptidase YedK
MYDRYTIGATAESLIHYLEIKNVSQFKSTFNAAPTQKLPIITNRKPDQIQLFHWGLFSKLSNNKSMSPRLFNLSAQALVSKSMHKKALLESRCLIPADGFYMWKQLTKKQKVPYYFHPNNRNPFFIAGIWEEFEEIDGSTTQSFNMITVPSWEPVASFQDDIPAILTIEQSKTWLSSYSSENDLIGIFQKIYPIDLSYYTVSPLINNLKVSDQSLIKPSQPSDQHGNYTLF